MGQNIGAGPSRPQTPASPRPEAYELGEWDFYNITLNITPDVLIPRPDSEHLVDVALEFLRDRAESPDGRRPARLLDLCCGSGCIGLAVEANAPGVSVVWGDISDAALAVARSNGCGDARVLDALSPPPPDLGVFDAVVCNPPYVAPDDDALDASVREWEPPVALFGGTDGLDFYRSLLPDWLAVLRPGGLFAVEVGYDGAETVSRMAREAGLTGVTVRKDYAGHGRIVYGYTQPHKRGARHG
ncbi:MAG: peptide chain release factor N(5)-glutamine methyltransferase [Oscillospiraceae bacterium]|nr:peptide chain release factor N(5)-glutamine methyltransferase [Oscillospiraceae bacterium]